MLNRKWALSAGVPGTVRSSSYLIPMPYPRTPAGQIAFAALLVTVFVAGHWMLVGDEFDGGFAQCFPVTLIATLLLDRIYSLLATISAFASTFILYYDIQTTHLDQPGMYLSVGATIASITIVALIGMHQRRLALESRARIAQQEHLNDELRKRVAQSFTTALRLSPEPADFASADDYHREWSARLGALAGSAEILRHDIERQCILPDLAETAVLPIIPDGRATIRLPRCSLPRSAVVSLGLTLQGLAVASLRSGALADREGRVRLTGSLLQNGSIELIWREIGPRAGSDVHLTTIRTTEPKYRDGLARMDVRIAPCEYQCMITALTPHKSGDPLPA